LPSARAHAQTFLTGGGEMGALMRAHDWSTSPLSDPETWPQSLRAVVALMINSRYPMFLAWGPDLAFLYNDAYRPIFGAKHPAALGLPFAEVWSEIWDDISPLVDRALAGEATFSENLHLVMHRNGYPEDTWYSFSYSPVRDESGAVAGMFCACTETTGQVLAERRQAAEQDRLRRMFEQAPGFMAMLEGPEHVFTLTNAAYAQLVGHREVIGKPVREALPEVAGQGYFELLDRVYASGESFVGRSMAVGLQRTPGAPVERRYVDLVYQPITGDGGAVTGIFVEGYDVTERQQVEAELRESESRLRLATEFAEVGFWDVDEVNQVLHWPSRVKGMFGISADVPVSMQDFYEGLHPDDREATSAAYLAAADPKRRAVYDVEYRTIGKEDGQLRWVAAKGRGVFNEVGRCERVLGTAIDITRRKLAEEGLKDLTRTLEQRVDEARAAQREADALYRAYFELTPEALFVIEVGPDGFRVEQINPAHEVNVGFKLDEVRGRRLEEILPPDVAERVVAAYRKVVETGVVYQYREMFDLGGRVRHWDTSLAPVSDDTGRVTRIIGSSRDVTRQVLAEDALRQTQKMEAVGQLTGGIAHDFNNLLSAVVGSLDLIRRKPDDQIRVKRLAQTAIEAAERGARLTSQLLTFSRAQRIDLKPVSVTSLVNDMQELLARTLGPQIRIEFDLQSDDAVLSDATQLEMAVLNLAINARDAMPAGGTLRIETRTRQASDDPYLATGRYVELAVCDDGTGMAPDVAERAMDPFFTTKGVGKGTGLGLSQVFGMAKQAGGTVRIESREGAGTTVRVLLPRTDAAAEAPVREGDADAFEEKSAGTVLVVDDDPDVRRMLVESLDALGYRVREAEDGPTALSDLEDQLPDVLMVDYAMPVMNGAELAKAVRAKAPDLPIVFASGYSDTAAIEAAAGKNTPLLRKPFRLAELQEVLTVAIESSVTETE
jgi:PAS domain S-box-containing protein